MSKNILIVEGDTELAASIRSELESRGFAVDETTDGKGSIEKIRSTRPDLVLMSVDLPGGQNGYLLCGKLKKDDDLKSIPLVILGDPGGFDQHRKLKTRADDYVAKPLDLEAVVTAIGNLVGMPELAEATVEGEEELALDGLGEEPAEISPDEEIAVEDPGGGDATIEGDPELDMLDAAFDGISGEEGGAVEEAVEAPPEPQSDGEDEGLGALDALGDESFGEQAEASGGGDEADEALSSLGGEEFASDETTVGTSPVEEEAVDLDGGEPPELSPEPSTNGATQLAAALEEAQGRIAQLEADLAAKTAEASAARSTGGKSDKDFFALKEASNKKDKEVLKLKSELNDKDKEIVELKDRENELEQKLHEAAQKSGSAQSEIAKRDAQVKSATAKADQLSAEKKKLDEQLKATKDEARNATSKISSVQRELDQANARAAKQNDELEKLRARVRELEDAASKNDERVTKLYQRIKGDEKLREKTKKALSIALQLLDEQQALPEEGEDKEAAA